jgi:hypothetical protein
VLHVQPLDQNIDAASAGKPNLPRSLVACLEVKESGRHVSRQAQAFLDESRFNTSTADGTDNSAVCADGHFRARSRRGGAIRLGDGRESDTLLARVEWTSGILSRISRLRYKQSQCTRRTRRADFGDAIRKDRQKRAASNDCCLMCPCIY